MRSTGVVVEYNPFHNGHLYHLVESRRITQADVMIAVMSGNFLQRGEPALVSKWARTNMALKSGVDIVIELPYSFAVQKADTFAFGAVSLLNGLKCNSICFGSESGEFQPFLETFNLLNQNKVKYEESVRSFMKTGMSYPSAYAAAYKGLGPDSTTVDLSKPNNILGYHYLSAAAQINDQLELFTIGRKNTDYHDVAFTNESIASATAIRKSLHQHLNLDKIQPYIPETTLSELKDYRKVYGQFHQWEQYWPILQYRLMTMEPEELRQIYDMEEGIENRLKKAALSTDSFHAFMGAVKTKRYTWTRLQRICVHVLTNTKKSTIQSLNKNPQYARLLGMNSKGRGYLSHIKKEMSLPLVSRVSAYPAELLALDIKASNVYAHVLPEPNRSKLLAMEYGQPPIYLKSE